MHYGKKFVGARRLHHIYFLKAFHVFKIVSFFQGTNILSFDFRSFVISITYFHDGMGTVERLFFAGDYFSWISCFFLNLRKIAKTQLQQKNALIANIGSREKKAVLQYAKKHGFSSSSKGIKFFHFPLCVEISSHEKKYTYIVDKPAFS